MSRFNIHGTDAHAMLQFGHHSLEGGQYATGGEAAVQIRNVILTKNMVLFRKSLTSGKIIKLRRRLFHCL